MPSNEISIVINLLPLIPSKNLQTHLRLGISAEADEIRNNLYWMHQALPEDDLDDAHCHHAHIEVAVEEAVEDFL
jgi:hypothetical protein